MFGFLNPQVMIGGAVVIALASGAGYIKGRSDGYALGTAKGVTATMEQLQQRGEINEDVRNTGECELIVELGGVCGDGTD